MSGASPGPGEMQVASSLESRQICLSSPLIPTRGTEPRRLVSVSLQNYHAAGAHRQLGCFSVLLRVTVSSGELPI